MATKNIASYAYGAGKISELESMLKPGKVVYCIDQYFENTDLMQKLPITDSDQMLFLDTSEEPTTQAIDQLVSAIDDKESVGCIVAIGSGTTLDVAKAISNLVTNGGKAADYQGWDLVKKPGVYKIGVPTLSGTGAETSRTCVMTNTETGVKLGMNSDYTVYDALILDPDLSATAPREQYFYTGMDAFMHCTEILRGRTRHPLADSYAEQALKLCDEVFLSDDMMSDENRGKLMIASYFGGCALANSMVGMIHPFSAGLSVVLGQRHCIANCLILNALKNYYPEDYDKLQRYLQAQSVELPSLDIKSADESVYDKLYDSTVVHSKPLINHLGDTYKDELTKEKVSKIFAAI